MLIKKLFGDYSRFVKFIKIFLSALAFLIVLYVTFLIIFHNNKGKINLSKSKGSQNLRPYLTIINSAIDGIYFDKYKYNIISSEAEKDSQGNFILYKLEAKVASKKNKLTVTSDKASYSEGNQRAVIRENIKIYYLDTISFSQEIFANFADDFFSSTIKFTTNSDNYHFEALNGFKANKIDFSQLDFFGPIRLELKKKNSMLVSDNLTVFVTQKDKNLISSEFRKNVIFKNEKFEIKSDKADYLEDKKQFIFYDNLTIKSHNTQVKGDIFIYDLQKDMGFVRSKTQYPKRIEIYFDDKKK